MPKVRVHKDEQYRWFENISQSASGVEVVIPREVLQRWRAAEQELDDVYAIVSCVIEKMIDKKSIGAISARECCVSTRHRSQKKGRKSPPELCSTTQLNNELS